MALRLNPDHPLVWRSPRTLQFGVEEPVVQLDAVDESREMVLGLASTGVSRPVLEALASARRIPPARVDEILVELEPVLGQPLPADPLRGRCLALDGHGAAAAAVARLLEQLGARVRPLSPGAPREGPGRAEAGAQVHLAVVVSHYATAPRRAARWLRADVPHLLVEFGDRSIRVGPVVVPGRGPCAMCLELERVDLDGAWPAIATQAARRTAPSADPLGIATTAPLVARVIVEHLDTGGWAERALRARRPGFGARQSGTDAWASCGISVERLSSHPRCGCRSP